MTLQSLHLQEKPYGDLSTAWSLRDKIRDVSRTPNNSTDDHILEAVAGFTYQGSTTASNLSLDAELNKRNSNSSSRKTYLGERHAIVNYKHKDSGILGSCTLYTLVRPSEYWIMYSR